MECVAYNNSSFSSVAQDTKKWDSPAGGMMAPLLAPEGPVEEGVSVRGP